MITVDLNQIPSIPADEAYMLTGVEAKDFNQPGVYHVLIGSRGEIDSFEFLGDVNEIQVESLEEIQARAADEDERDYYEEFYGIGIEDDHINFSYTEEGYDVWVRVA